MRRIRIWAARILVLGGAALLLGLLAWGVRGLLGGENEEGQYTFGTRLAQDDPEIPAGEPLIVLDAGHGGEDQGTSSGDTLEKDLNLAVTRRLAQELTGRGAAVILTREDDVRVDLEERAAFANRYEADLFVSIHCNYCEDDDAVQGLEAYYREGSGGGQALAESIVQAADGEEKIVCRGTRTADFRVLRKTEMPAVLVELGYLSSREERNLLTQEDYQELLAGRLAEGIMEAVIPAGE